MARLTTESRLMLARAGVSRMSQFATLKLPATFNL